ETSAGHKSEGAGCISLHAGHVRNEVKNVAGQRRQITNFVFRKNSSDRIRRRRQDRIRRNRHFHIRSGCSTNLEVEIQLHLLRPAELNVGEGLRLEARKFGTDLVSARLQRREIVSAGFVSNRCVRDIGADVGCCNRDTWYQSSGSVRYIAANRGIHGLAESSNSKEQTADKRS